MNFLRDCDQYENVNMMFPSTERMTLVHRLRYYIPIRVFTRPIS